MSWTIWHNPRCSKSRQTLQLLRDNGIEPTVRLYLQDPPSADEIAEVITKLAVEPRGLMRRKEAPYKALELKDDSLSSAQLIAAMAEHPVLIERPVVLSDTRAALGRPPENILEIL